MKKKLNSEWLRGSLDLMVLAILAEGKKYGYLIGQDLRQASGDLVQVQAGTLYPLLHRLEQEKLVASSWDQSTGRPRKWYELTAAGRRRLSQQAAEWMTFSGCLERLVSAFAPRKPAEEA